VHRRTEVIDSLGHKTIYEWNDAGLVTRETDHLGGVTQTEWGLFNEKLSETNPNGEKKSFEYDDFGRMVSVTDATGASVKYLYDAVGNHTTYIDPLGQAWVREYDERRNAIAITNPLGHRQAFELDRRGLPVRAIDALGRASEFTWNSAGLLAGYTDRAGARTESAYDALGRIISRIDPLGGVHRLTYDRRGRLIEEVDPAGRRTRRRWNAAGYVTEFTDPMGRVSTITYGAMGRTASVHTPSGRESRFRYDTEGELVGVVQPGGDRWEYVRDPVGRVVEERTPDGRAIRFGYDKSGRLVESVNARGHQLRMTLDPAGRITARHLPDGTTEVFRYDPRGLPVLAKNSAAELNWVYDPCGRPIAETVNGKTTESAYDPDGNRVSRTSALGHRVTLEYDPEGRLVAAADRGTELFRSTLDALGQERRRVAPGGAVWEWDYLPTGEMTVVRVRGQSSFERLYSYDPGANPTGQTDTVFGRQEYHHDADGYLIGARLPDGTVAEFARDPAGNILPPPGIHVRRDRDGNVVEKRTDKGGWQFTYDMLGRLARANSDGGVEVAFAYDPLGRRIHKTVNGKDRIEYLWDGDLVLGEVGTDHAEYLFRPGTFEPLARLGSDGAALIEADPIGLPRSAVGLDGQLVWHAAFEPFGGIVAERGRPGLIPVRYPGQFADTETGLFYNRFRYHDPEQRAYLSPDPYGYTGCGGVWDYTPNPLVWSDPYGLRACRTAAHRQAKERLGIPASQQPTRSWTIHDPARVRGPGTRHPDVRHQGKISEYEVIGEGGSKRYVYVVDHNHDPFHGGMGHVHTAQPPPGVDRLSPGMRYNEIGEPIPYG
jgi:RHS repeat-associated protein